jgi:hypothetical protein
MSLCIPYSESCLSTSVVELDPYLDPLGFDPDLEIFEKSDPDP